MDVIWFNECHLCESPLGPYVYSSIDNISKINYYGEIRPFFLENNEKRYMFVGEKVHVVCYSCFINKPKFSPWMQNHQQIGKKIKRHTKSKTKEEILLWVDGLKRYLKNNN